MKDALVPRGIVVMLLVLYGFVVVLSVKCVADLASFAQRFPWWFVPAFGFGVAVLLTWCGAMVYRVSKIRDAVRWAGGKEAMAIWLLLPLAVVCNTGVHGFYPFRTRFIHFIPYLDTIYGINMALAILAFCAGVCAAGLHALGRRRAAIVVLLMTGLVLLVPNDACANPFNIWWINTLGASPLMYIPVMVANMLGTAALLGINTRLNILALAAVDCSVALLGLGHMYRVIW